MSSPTGKSDIAGQSSRSECIGVEELVRALGLVSDVGVRRAIEHLPRLLRKDERVLCGAAGFLEGRSGLVVATSVRFLFVHKQQAVISAPYDEILTFRARAGIIAAELEVQDNVGRAVIKQVHPRSRLVELVGLLRLPESDRSIAATSADSASRTNADSTSRTNDRPEWKPKLRPKLSALPQRPVGQPRIPIQQTRDLRLAFQTPLAVEATATSWRPTFQCEKPGGSNPPTGRPGMLARAHIDAAPLNQARWLRGGEWVIASFDQVVLMDESPAADMNGIVVVTNRRIAFISDDAVAIDWLLTAASETALPACPNRIDLPGPSALDFPNATMTRDFVVALRAAADLSGAPRAEAGEEEYG